MTSATAASAKAGGAAGRRPDRVLGCVLPRGVGVNILERLFREKDVTRAELHSARGFLGSDPGGMFNRVEKDFLMVILEAARADEIFEWIYREARVAELEGRFLYMTPVSRATAFALPSDVAVEGEPPDRRGW